MAVNGTIETMNPQSANEQFLKAIATGDTSSLPEPQTRNQIYLDYIARNQGGGSVPVDLTPTEDSENLVTSGGVFAAIQSAITGALSASY